MIKYYQRNEKDCLNCVLATWFQIPYEEIPKFYDCIKDMENPSKEEVDLWDSLYDNWLNSIGKYRIVIAAEYKNDTIDLPYFSKKPFIFMAELKKKDRNFSHAVLVRLNLGRLELLHDPQRDTDYDLRDIRSIELILSLGLNDKD